MTQQVLSPAARVVTPDNVKLAVREWGDPAAPAVVCVHGYPDNGSVWDGVVAQLSNRYRVVVYDVRGAGESDHPRHKDAYRLDRLANDLAAVIDAVSPDRPVHLVGHDWGAIQCWHAVTGDRLRGRVASYTSISGPCLDHAAHWFRSRLRPSPRDLRELLTQAAFSWYIGYFHLPLLPELGWRTGVARRVMSWMRRLDKGARASVPENRTVLADALHGLRLYRTNMLPRLRRPEERRTDIPVQVLAPSRDAFVSVPLQTDIARWVPDLRVRHVAGGHWLPSSRPDLVARCVSELVDHVQGGQETRPLRRARVSAAPRSRFADQLVVITGAGSGIGRATALAFADAGAEVVATDIDEAAAARTAELAHLLGARAHAHAVDVSHGNAVYQLAEQVRADLGVPDIVVNNAGIAVSGSLLVTSEEDWRRIIDVNLWGVIHGCRAFAEQMVERGEGGHLVNVASAAAYLFTRMLPAYSTTKSAVLTLTQCARAELAAEGIGVTAICPGFVNTNITRNARFVGVTAEEQERHRRVASRLYGRRNYTPDRTARHILRAVERDVPIAPITPEAKVGLALSRLTPGLLRAGARFDLTPH
ncbi:short chain dehydrogenase [Longimycelium tulufanense]|uniref:Short chain dehydrogenase n=1 Tax=Longimycelium tulufanense TaxID=907463 RepID=A0A8J3FVS4_9PSEU|nr:SDR family oxidoreductase [Longimycelium tulufanense]GGM53666.1 short chain dehydrogenase [Longimycelium tulufanense]